MTSPFIGVTTTRFPNKADLPMVGATQAYVYSVMRAGGIPLMIPPGLSREQIDALMSRLQGVLLTGGGDIDPQRFNGEPNDSISDIDAERDELEIQLVQQASKSGLPFFGICRGHQVVNVALGGTLYTDIAAQIPQAQKHDFYPNIPRTYMAHNIHAEPGSLLYEILGVKTVFVNSLHHQAVKDIAPGLKATAYSHDGLIEGLELEGHPFGLAVQWHPEWLQNHSPMQALFKTFIKAAAERRVDPA